MALDRLLADHFRFMINTKRGQSFLQRFIIRCKVMKNGLLMSQFCSRAGDVVQSEFGLRILTKLFQENSSVSNLLHYYRPQYGKVLDQTEGLYWLLTVLKRGYLEEIPYLIDFLTQKFTRVLFQEKGAQLLEVVLQQPKYCLQVEEWVQMADYFWKRKVPFYVSVAESDHSRHFLQSLLRNLPTSNKRNLVEQMQKTSCYNGNQKLLSLIRMFRT